MLALRSIYDESKSLWEEYKETLATGDWEKIEAAKTAYEQYSAANALILQSDFSNMKSLLDNRMQLGFSEGLSSP